MTRVNVIPVEELHDKHLIAEYREIPRIVNLVRKNLEKKNIFDMLKEIPDSYRLGTGHVNFFKNKLHYIKDRHELLKIEGKKRGFNLTSININLEGIPDCLCKNFKPDNDSIFLNRKRIEERLKQIQAK